MPLELGVFLGAERFGTDEQRKKKCLVLDKEPYRYQKFISDISGQDIHVHNNDPKQAIKIVRDWLRNTSRRTAIPGGHEIYRRYQIFLSDLPEMCHEARLKVKELIFNDFT